MNSLEKADMLKNTIERLYSEEGRSISYISQLLEINRKVLSDKIKREWRLTEAEPRRHASASTQKFINRNRERILSMLNRDMADVDIAKTLGIPRGFLAHTVIPADALLLQAKNARIARANAKRNNQLAEDMAKSSRNYDWEDLPNEIWGPILGYEGYQISNMGRVRHYVKTYDTYVLLKQTPNKNSGRPYVMLGTNATNAKRRNIMVARLVAFAFCDGHSETRNTVNHKNGDVTDNRAENLEWMSQAENNRHAYATLRRTPVSQQKRRYRFNQIVYKDKYQFSTVAAFARFIGKSETQTRRYLDEPEKHEISFI